MLSRRAWWQFSSHTSLCTDTAAAVFPWKGSDPSRNSTAVPVRGHGFISVAGQAQIPLDSSCLVTVPKSFQMSQK